ncbi:CTB family bacteriocin [Leptolyngbya sp. AN03gr2]|uniref:CTB family bacteriocin n=1 Tax=unclassified Leptolyngbya TaxID=2650499 RepID=UPI003D30F7AC
MIITDLSYQEVTTEANELEGGVDFTINATKFQQALSVMQSGSNSGPGGSSSFTNAQHVKIDTYSFNAVVLGA